MDELKDIIREYFAPLVWLWKRVRAYTAREEPKP